MKQPLKTKKIKNQKEKKVISEIKRKRNELISQYQKMNMSKLNNGIGIIPEGVVVDTGKYSIFIKF